MHFSICLGNYLYFTSVSAVKYELWWQCFPLQASLVGFLPILGSLASLVHMCLLYSLYTFEYKWVNMGELLTSAFNYQLSSFEPVSSPAVPLLGCGRWWKDKKEGRNGVLFLHISQLSPFLWGRGKGGGLRKIGCGCHWDLWTPTLFHNLANLSFQGKKYWFATNTWNKSEFRTILQFM